MRGYAEPAIKALPPAIADSPVTVSSCGATMTLGDGPVARLAAARRSEVVTRCTADDVADHHLFTVFIFCVF